MEEHSECKLKTWLSAAKAGDSRAFEALLTAYSPLIESQAKHFADPFPEQREDLYQEACIAFYRAVETFDVTQDRVRFGLYAKTCIHNRLITYVRPLYRRDTETPLWDEAATDADPGQTLVEEESYRALLEHIRSVLSPYENHVWRMYLSGRTAREIASLMDKDERSVQNAIYRIRKKLRNSLPYP